MRKLYLLLILIISITSCKPESPAELIESYFELQIPDCYEIIEDAKETNYQNTDRVFELKFEEKCMWKMYEEMILVGNCRNYYAGTNWWNDPIWVNDKETALMYLNLETHILHFEDYNEDTKRQP